jgi:hypothetical protein
VKRIQNGSSSSDSPAEVPDTSPPVSAESPEPRVRSQRRLRGQFVAAIADGTPVDEWASLNGVPRRTAFRWAREPKLRLLIERQRRQILDAAVGRMTRGVPSAVSGILDLAMGASSESVRLAASRAVMSDMMTVSKFGILEDRMTKLEEKLRARAANTPRSR